MRFLSDEKRKICLALQTKWAFGLGAIVNGLCSNGAMVWLTGGAVRDIIKGRKLTDIDLVCDKDPIPFLKSFADRNGCGFVVLDTARKIARLVTKSEFPLTVDVTIMQGRSIEDDLKCRDFTVNAIAVRLGDESAQIIDPLDGIADLQHNILRPVSGTAFADDPIRIVRAYRFESAYGFSPAPEISAMAFKYKALLAKVPGERITQELVHILKTANSVKAFLKMDKTKVLEMLFAEVTATKGVTQNEWHHLDVYEHTMETLARLEDITKETPSWLLPWQSQIDDSLNRKVTGSLDVLSITKLAALYHDTGKLKARAVKNDGKVTFYGHERESEKKAIAIAGRLRFSNTARDGLSLLVRNHLRPLNALHEGEISRRSVYRYVRDVGVWAVPALLLSIADALATNGPAVTDARRASERSAIIKIFNYMDDLAKTPAKPIVTGQDILNTFNIEPGPTVGLLLESAKEAFALGEISTREEALVFLKKRFRRENQ